MFGTSQVGGLLRKLRHCTPLPRPYCCIMYITVVPLLFCHQFMRSVQTLALVWVPTTQAVGGKLQRVRDPE